MKTLIFPVGIFTAFLLLAGCDHQPSDPKDLAEQRNEDKFSTRASEKDAQFVVDAASAGMLEVGMSENAVSNASSSEVKKFAQQMIDAHRPKNEKIERLAKEKQISIPTVMTKDQVDEINELGKKTGNDYDMTYMDKQISMHKDVIALFERASKQAEDTELQEFFADALPDLRMHLDMATSVRDHLK